MSPPRPVLQVAVNTPLHRLFDYLAPDNAPAPVPGQRVRVPFGKREQVGVIVNVAGSSALPASRLRQALAILDEVPLLDEHLVATLRWCTSYYQAPPGEVFATALPVMLRHGATADQQPVQVWQCTETGRAVDMETLRSRASVQATLLTALRETDHLTNSACRELNKGWRKVITGMVEKGWVQQTDALPMAAIARETAPQLNTTQEEAVRQVQSSGFNACLLEGVTGSGKTEVYLQLIAKQLAAGRQAMVLVPEIGLTPQLVDRFRRRVAGTVGVMHSGLSDGQRMSAWLDAQAGNCDVLIGTRSAVFTPLARPGLIVVDEEHDTSFKQQDGFRYSARDLAVYRARQLDIPVVLGSATPALESLRNAREQRYSLATLPERAGSARQPDIHTIDLRHHGLHEGLSQPLKDAMARHLDDGGQVLIYLNRRGFAPTLLCPACGHVEECRRCDARMVMHQKTQRLICHHCGSEKPVATRCSECQQELVPLGQGTERLEQALGRLYPALPLVRIDRDTTRRKGELESRLDQIRSGEARIILGTQMLAKGHDFPNVTLVGIVDSDQGLFGTDFRAPEKLAQSILQVAGRAGRADKPGEVWIQTYYPEHPLLQTLLREGYGAFAEQELQARQTAGWPPYSHLALLRCEAARRDVMFEFLQQAAAHARQLDTTEIRLLGPASAPMEKRSGRYRGQILIQSGNRVHLQRFLHDWREQFSNLPAARRVRWSLDVDPGELF